VRIPCLAASAISCFVALIGPSEAKLDSLEDVAELDEVDDDGSGVGVGGGGGFVAMRTSLLTFFGAGRRSIFGFVGEVLDRGGTSELTFTLRCSGIVEYRTTDIFLDDKIATLCLETTARGGNVALRLYPESERVDPGICLKDWMGVHSLRNGLLMDLIIKMFN